MSRGNANDRTSETPLHQATELLQTAFRSGDLGLLNRAIDAHRRLLEDRRIAKRRGKQKPIVATGNTVLTIVCHLLTDLQARYYDLGADHYESRTNTARRARTLAIQLQPSPAQKIIIRDGKAVITEPEAT